MQGKSAYLTQLPNPVRLVLDQFEMEQKMTTIGAYEAKTRFSELIRRVSRGEQIVITHHGVPVAVMAPVEQTSAQPPQELIAAFRAFRAGRSLGGLSIRELIAEGRT